MKRKMNWKGKYIIKIWAGGFNYGKDYIKDRNISSAFYFCSLKGEKNEEQDYYKNI